MYDYPELITEFIKVNFEPVDFDRANVKHTTTSLLAFLFRVFPHGCITDYELSDILTDLGYRRETYVHEETVRCEDEKGKEYFEINKSLAIGWCMRTHHDLHTEDIRPPEF